MAGEDASESHAPRGADTITVLGRGPNMMNRRRFLGTTLGAAGLNACNARSAEAVAHPAALKRSPFLEGGPT
jgi:hypothetical protein